VRVLNLIVRNRMTISNDELSKLIELSDKANWKWGTNTTIYTNPFIDAANPTTVKAMAEELLAARAMRDSIYNCDTEEPCADLKLLKVYDDTRAKNEGK